METCVAPAVAPIETASRGALRPNPGQAVLSYQGPNPTLANLRPAKLDQILPRVSRSDPEVTPRKPPLAQSWKTAVVRDLRVLERRFTMFRILLRR